MDLNVKTLLTLFQKCNITNFESTYVHSICGLKIMNTYIGEYKISHRFNRHTCMYN